MAPAIPRFSDSYPSGLLGTNSSTTVLRPSLLGSMTSGGPSGLLPSCPGPCFGSCSVLMCLLFQCLWGSLMIETSTFNASMLRAGQQPCQNGLIWRPGLTTIGGAEMAVFLGSALCSALWGAYYL